MIPLPQLAEVYSEAATIRARLLDSGFQETVVAADQERPQGLRATSSLSCFARMDICDLASRIRRV